MSSCRDLQKKLKLKLKFRESDKMVGGGCAVDVVMVGRRCLCLGETELWRVLPGSKAPHCAVMLTCVLDRGMSSAREGPHPVICVTCAEGTPGKQMNHRRVPEQLF